MRIGHGYDVHRFSGDAQRRLWLGLVECDGPGLDGHSDADAATHALCDAILGAASLGDLGRHFPDSEPSLSGISSRELLERTLALASEAGFVLSSGDVTIVAETPKLGPALAQMSESLNRVCDAPVNVKATTTEKLGAIGRGEGIAAYAVVLLTERA